MKVKRRFKEDKKEFEKLKEEFFQKLAEYEVCLENDNKDCDQPKPKPPLVPPFKNPLPQPFNKWPDHFPGIPHFPFDPNDIIGPRATAISTSCRPISRWPMNRVRKRVGRHGAGARGDDHRTARSDDIDPRSFRLGDFGWGGMRFSPSPDSAFYQTTIDETDTLGILVQVTATIDVSTGTAVWNFLSIDPATAQADAEGLNWSSTNRAENGVSNKFRAATSAPMPMPEGRGISRVCVCKPLEQ